MAFFKIIQDNSMNKKFHEGEYHIQEMMGIRKFPDTLSSMIKDTIPKIASDFLEKLSFCVLTLSTQKDDLFTIGTACKPASTSSCLCKNSHIA